MSFGNTSQSDGIPVDRPTGNLWIDNNGSANYSLPLEVPPGIGKDNTPILSLVYSQGNPNGIVGQGWILGGLSAIQRAPRNLAIDGVNAPVTYNNDGTRFALDGMNLLLVSGEYGTNQAVYKVEIDTGKTVVASGTGTQQGFIVSDPTGRTMEYGTTPDSRAMSSNGKNIREWRLHRNTDVHGNTMTFEYTKTPRLRSGQTGSQDTSTLYLNRISYTSNASTSAPATDNRFIDFLYDVRSDPVIVTGAGDILEMNYRLSRIETAILPGADLVRARAYNLDYSYSPVSYASQLLAVTEEGTSGSTLSPTMFTYTAPTDPKSWFKPTSSTMTLTGAQTTDVATILPLNIGGRAFSDIGLVCQDPYTGVLSIKTYLATVVDIDLSGNSTLAWNASTSDDGHRDLLPPFANGSIPAIMSTDLSGDGQNDIVLAFNSGSGLAFSLSKCTGRGFQDYKIIRTLVDWHDSDKFYAMDCNGNGHVDVVQVSSTAGYITFRTFVSIKSSSGEYTLGGAIETLTNDNDANTTQWIPADINRDGLQDLIRVWYEDDNSGILKLNATSYISVAKGDHAVFEKAGTVLLGEYTPQSLKDVTILSCDINADGIQDLVTCQVQQSIGSGIQLRFDFRVFLCDGAGGFISRPGRVLEYLIPNQSSAVKDAEFQVMDLDGDGIPSLVYLYSNLSGTKTALIAQGNYSANITDFLSLEITHQENSLLKNAVFTAADVNGSGKAGWLAWAADGGPAVSISPVYNTQPLGDVLTSVVNPLGLRTVPTYRPLSLPSSYRLSAVNPNDNVAEVLRPASSTLPTQGPFVSVLGTASYVVTQLDTSSVQEKNAFAIADSVVKFYEGASIDLGGRGWQGFSKIYSYSRDMPSLMVESFAQVWPLTGLKIQEDVYDIVQSVSAFTSSPDGSFPFPTLNQLVKSQITEYDTPSTTPAGSTIYTINKTLDQVNLFESGSLVKQTGTVFGYDMDGFVLSESIFTIESGKTDRIFQKWTCYTYTSFNSLKGMLEACKISSLPSNLDDMTRFKEGDLSLIQYEYDQINNTIRERKAWSIYHQRYISHNYLHDNYGNEIEHTDPAGLIEKTTYDPTFHTFPTKILQTGLKLAVDQARCYAFDARFGTQTVDTQPNNQISLLELDEFGRSTSIKVTSIPSQSSSTFRKSPSYLIGDEGLLQRLDHETLTEIQRTKYAYIEGQAQRWLSKLVVMNTNIAASDQSSFLNQYLDANNRIRVTATTQGALLETWQYKKFDSAGNTTSESISLVPHNGLVTEQQKLNWYPEGDLCKITGYDALNRPSWELQPRPNINQNRLITNMQYENGDDGMIVTEASVMSGQTVPISPPLSRTEVTFGMVAGESKVTSTTDDLGKRSTFSYDSASGFIHASTDPSGKADISNHDLQGLLLSSDNLYQNPQGNTSHLARTFTYDIANRVATETNVTGEVTSFEYDALGRVTLRHGSDNRTITYTYDGSVNGVGHLTNVTVSKPGDIASIESEYEFSYDLRGRPITTILSLNVADRSWTYEVNYTYDLQGQMTSKILPDGTIVTISFDGNLVKSSSMSPSVSEPWALTSRYPKYDPSGRCIDWALQGSGAIAAEFYGAAKYDNNSRSTDRILGINLPTKQDLVHQQYTYDDMGRIVQSDELQSTDQAQYQYKNKRLLSSVLNGNHSAFEYDDSGNLKGKGGISFSYSKTGVSGTDKDSKTVFNVEYDDNGRMRSRTLQDTRFVFQYDGFDKMSKITNETTHQSSFLLSDFLGRKLVQSFPDGTIKINVCKDYHVTIKPDNSNVVERYFYGPDGILAAVTSISNSSGWSHDLTVFFSNTKTNITHIFDRAGVLRRKLAYDDFGMLIARESVPPSDLTATYESQNMYFDTGLLDFGARCYDPLLGRFTTPDSQWSADPLTQRDIMNRYAFENNDPINHMDPTGHWNWNVFAAVVIGIVFVAVAVGVAVLSGGAAIPLIGVTGGWAVAFWGGVVGGLVGAGFASIGYGIANTDETDGDKFWRNWAANVAVGFGTGFVTGFACAGISVFKLAADASKLAQFGRAALQFAARGAVTAAGSVLDQLAFNGIAGDDLRGGLVLATVAGFAFGAGLAGPAEHFGVAEKVVDRGMKGTLRGMVRSWKELRYSFLGHMLEQIGDAVNMVTQVEALKRSDDDYSLWTGKYPRTDGN
ncbi:hypothetical protein MMC34_001693 [Xylographa carneopallida]|nr:hypothetical protein [Xylographa carneopallida]